MIRSSLCSTIALGAALIASCASGERASSPAPACAEGFVTVGDTCKPDLCLDLDCGEGLCVQNGEEAVCLEPGVEPPDDLPDDPPDDPSADPASPCEPNPCSAHNRDVCVSLSVSAYRCDCRAGTVDTHGVCVAACDRDPALCAATHASKPALASANGHGALVYDQEQRKTTAFLEHVYRNWDDGVWTRDLLYDTYFGVRTAAGGRWLGGEAPLYVGYLEDSGIIHLVHRVEALRVDTYVYAPWELSRPALVMLAQVTNEGDDTTAASLYSLHNYHLGYTSSTQPAHPDAREERLVFDAVRGAYVEQGVGGTLLHYPIGGADHHGATPDDPWLALSEARDLADTADSGLGDDRVAGFQRDVQLAPGERGWLGVVTAFERGASATGLTSDVVAVYGDLAPHEALSRARDEWRTWRKPAPAGLSPAELQVFRQAEAFLRQGQVWESTDASQGQIVASLPPGNWNITWVRDMAYAIVALVKLGHWSEARAALEFVLAAESGAYSPQYVSAPYRVSITRYFGRGKEETDLDANGPNIELDGFGLFLWALGEYVRASGDATLLDASTWPLVKTGVADALVQLIDPANGLVSADSSIWEVHWNGRQKQFAYTSLAAARGLCEAAHLAELRADDTLAQQYRGEGVALRDAVATHLVDDDDVLAGSLQELQAGHGYHDLAAVEAFAWELMSPHGAVAQSTLAALPAALRVSHARGLARNDDGGWYDSREWVFIDLRTSVAQRRAGEADAADALLDWVTAQAIANQGIIAELHDPDTAKYEGAAPMIGFGAGAYVIAMLERAHGAANAPSCGSWETP